jgi:hypothetical protein
LTLFSLPPSSISTPLPWNSFSLLPFPAIHPRFPLHLTYLSVSLSLPTLFVFPSNLMSLLWPITKTRYPRVLTWNVTLEWNKNSGVERRRIKKYERFWKESLEKESWKNSMAYLQNLVIPNLI